MSQLDLKTPKSPPESPKKQDILSPAAENGPGGKARSTPFAVRLPLKVAGIASASWIAFLAVSFFFVPQLWPAAGTGLRMAVGLSAGLAPLILIWMIALVVQRSDPTLERRLALSRTLGRALAPVELAEQKLTRISEQLEKELQQIDALGAIAEDRMAKLEKRFNEQTANLFSAAADTEARAVHIQEKLTKEREALEQLYEAMEKRFTTAEARAHSAVASFENSMQKGETLTARTAEDMQRQIDHLSNQSDTFGAHVDVLRKEVEQMTQAMVKASKKLSDQSKKSEAAIEAGVDLSRSSIEDHQNQLAALEEQLAKQRDFLDQQIASSQSAGERLAEKLTAQMTAIDDQHGDTAKKIDALSVSFDATVAKLNEKTESIGTTLADYVANAESSMESTNKSLQKKIEKSRALLEEQQSELDGHIENRAEQFTAQLNSTSAEVQENMETVEARLNDLAKLHGRVKTVAAEAQELVGNHAKRIEKLLHATREQIHDTDAWSDEVFTRVSNQNDDLVNHATLLHSLMNEAHSHAESNNSSLASEIEKTRDALQAQIDHFKTYLSELNTSAEAVRGELQSNLATIEQSNEKTVAGQARLKKNISVYSRVLADTAGDFETRIKDISTLINATSGDLDENTRGALTAAKQVVTQIREILSEGRQDISLELEQIANNTSEQIRRHTERSQLEISKGQEEFTRLAAQIHREGGHMANRLSREAQRLADDADRFAVRTQDIERRLARQSQNDFVHTSTLLLESLQAGTIDIHKFLSTDVPEALWKSFQQGDRNIFARRLMKMTDKKSRDRIRSLFGKNSDFQEAASRFMQDFESLMERANIGDRGSAMQATLVSSEMGKLYVLLAQSLRKLS